MTPFERKVLTTVSRIPAGRVATYGDIARIAGRPPASPTIAWSRPAAGSAGIRAWR